MLLVAVDASAKEYNVETLVIMELLQPQLLFFGKMDFHDIRLLKLLEILIHLLQQKSDLRPAKRWNKDACVNGSCKIPEDAVQIKKSNIFRQSFTLDEYEATYDWYLIAASVALVIQGLYLFQVKRQERIPWKNFNFGF